MKIYKITEASEYNDSKELAPEQGAFSLA